ncbi:GDSL-type esterase/lipase family protein [Terrisporobacter glycolicus]|uniref:SGNH hydrolase-type esterase domain-containing protein n=2 Tax=Terrisporobacter glycolicus TaxID=36841 RepID=A0ABZ2EYL2_9FIRM
MNLSDSMDVLNKQKKIEQAQVDKGIEIVKELEKKDVLQSEKKINLVQSSLQGVNINQENSNEKVNLIDKFSNSVILGDSRAESILYYGILNNSLVVAYKGRNLISAQKEGDINKAINLAPTNIFLTYGLNDVQVYGNSSDFINEYKKVIKDIQIKLPNTKIYVNSIFEVNNKAMSKSPELKNVSAFNAAIMNMCNELGVTYIDGSSIVDESSYEIDGIHFKPGFNKKWVELLVQRANL